MANPRISGRVGQPIDLNVTFRHSGVPTDPYAIRSVEIYREKVLAANLIATIPVVDPTDVSYPLPLTRGYVDAETGACCTEPTADTVVVPGEYHLIYDVPADFSVPNVYFDVWRYFANNPCGDLGTEDPTGCDLNDPEYDGMLLTCCHRFWLYPDNWFCDDGLQTINFGFEPLSNKFNHPEFRPLEIGLMPLPLYDFNYNLVTPIIPYLQATITIETRYNEILKQNAEMTMGLRQGSYRTNPWVLRYNLRTEDFLKGTYKYRVTLTLPDGSTRTSKDFCFTVS